jgi:hypothetical protein
MQFGSRVDCALIIDGEEAFHDAVKESICNPKESCCIHLEELADITAEKITQFDPKPDMIFLRMGEKNPTAIDVLKSIKETDGIKYIPLVAVVDSNSNSQVKEAYGHFANCCIEIEDDAHSMASRITQVWDFWQQIAQLPPHMVPKI